MLGEVVGYRFSSRASARPAPPAVAPHRVRGLRIAPFGSRIASTGAISGSRLAGGRRLEVVEKTAVGVPRTGLVAVKKLLQDDYAGSAATKY
jgi:hypothetical protein